MANKMKQLTRADKIFLISIFLFYTCLIGFLIYVAMHPCTQNCVGGAGQMPDYTIY